MEAYSEMRNENRTILEVKNLKISFDTPAGEVQAVRGVNLAVKEGEVLALVGESGCGKSVLCKGMMKLLPASARIKEGQIFADGVDITGYRERDMVRLRGSFFSMVFQDPMTALDPTMTVGRQIAEAVKVHEPKLSKAELDKRVAELMELVGIEDAWAKAELFPYHFSGGMRQRAVLAIALAGNPSVLIADEPTTALDVTIQAQILDLFREIQKERHTATVFVTHDLGVVARVADRVAVMYAGKIVETGTVEDIFSNAKHPYTRGLLRSLPFYAKGKKELYTIPGMPPDLSDPPAGDAFACRNEHALAIDYKEEPPMFRVSDTHEAATWLLDERAPKIRQTEEEGGHPVNDIRQISDTKPEKRERESTDGSTRQNCFKPVEKEILVDVRNLDKTFTFGKKNQVKALSKVSFPIYRGEVFGLVGESGSGKSTAAKCMMNICRPDSGQVIYHGIDILDKKIFRTNRKVLEQTRQIIFQDSTSSLNPRMKVKDILAEPFRIHHLTPKRGSVLAEAAFQLKYVGLDVSCLEQYPPELSGGQRQRVAIARAVSMEPELLVADEPIASLDVSIQAQIVNLFRHLQREPGCSFLFIAHDLAMVEYLCDRVGVLYHGKLVEMAPVEKLFANPLHPYTKSLLSAIPIPDPVRERQRIWKPYEETEKEDGGNLIEAEPEHFVRIPG